MDKKYKYNVDIHYKLRVTRKKQFIFKEKIYEISNIIEDKTFYCSENNLKLECEKKYCDLNYLIWLAKWDNCHPPFTLLNYNYELIDFNYTINSKQEMTVKEAIEHYSIDELPIDKIISA